MINKFHVYDQKMDEYIINNLKPEDLDDLHPTDRANIIERMKEAVKAKEPSKKAQQRDDLGRYVSESNDQENYEPTQDLFAR
jgi:hypothetical protein